MVGRAFAAVNAALARPAAVVRRWGDRMGVGVRPLVWAGLLATFALVLDFVPLFDLLGYDFAFALGLAASLAAVDIGQGVVAGWRATNPTAPSGPAAPSAPAAPAAPGAPEVEAGSVLALVGRA